ncbi:MAG: chromosomal replication initiator DnaA [Rhodovulum sulfidophilum]|uniref:Chromosomal replication initiator DnaA n=1 Tax=Rhodovulum sulfidophilum TaxID=35806 RepID=A0A2W5N8U7_RHOSU|nr:MAG: chromosomal replication initiator DnaA [Rhodovulum sulfidophilum]
MARRGQQLVFDLATRPALGRADFFVSPANRLALAQLDAWPAWPEGRLAVTGPAGAGKTHLAHVWAARSGARILAAHDLASVDLATLPAEAVLAVEDADRLAGLAPEARAAAEEALFHIANRLAAGGGSLMVSGRAAPAQWDLALPDLASRLGAAPVARLEAPDDALLAAVLVKLFTDRQIPVTPDLVSYLVSRMHRSFVAAETLVARLDAAGLERRRRVTRALAAEVLRETG